MSKASARKRLAPKDARTFDQVCALPRDTVDGKTWWAILDAGHTVVLAQQRNGEMSTGKVEIPRREFERLARWYLTGVWSR